MLRVSLIRAAHNTPWGVNALQSAPLAVSKTIYQTPATSLLPAAATAKGYGTSQQPAQGNRWALAAAALVAASGLGLGIKTAEARQAQQQAPKQAGPQKGPAEPRLYTPEEVAKHRSPESRVWVTYKDGVYDITEFVAQHPGGAQKIMLAAGGSVEPFWGLYQQHQKQEVQDILKQYRIGTLKGAVAAAPLPDPYQNEPQRHPALLVRSSRPFNAETPPELLVAAPVTPEGLFYVRHHLPVPKVEDKAFKLKVNGDGLRSLELDLDQLKGQFRHATVAATIECAGNRRAEMKALPSPGDGSHQIKGLDWDAGAIGTAVWGGVLLRDVLKAAGLEEGDPAVAHIHFYGLDTDESGVPYAASIPVAKALSSAGDVLLAYEMNGKPIPTDHGGPLRAVVPGTVGARSVKWLGQILASPEECQGHWQQKDYKAFSPGTDWDNLDWSSAPAIQEMPVVSAICDPTPGSTISSDEGRVTVCGYAWSGGGRDIVRVDVSADKGSSWTPATLRKVPQSKPGRAWAWTLWEADIPLPKGFDAKNGGKLQFTCKATDESYNTQPESAAGVWNVRGLANNSWHWVTVDVEPES